MKQLKDIEERRNKALYDLYDVYNDMADVTDEDYWFNLDAVLYNILLIHPGVVGVPTKESK